MKQDEVVDIDPLTGEPLIYEDDFREFVREAEASYLRSREDTKQSEASRDEQEHDPNPEKPAKSSGEYAAECADLLENPQILTRVDSELKSSGFAGPTWPVLLMVLCLLSRHLPKPVSVIVRGESASGKSHAMKQALTFVSDDAFHALTSMSGKALYYDKTDLSHRFLVVYEAEGLRNDVATQATRTLLSEGRLDYQYTDFESKSVVQVTRKGPTGLLTSTAGAVDHELGTRVFSVPTDDSHDMTKAIMLAEASSAAGGVAAPVHSSFASFDRWLALNRKTVVVPFAERLAELTDGRAVRMRRDFDAVLQLTKAHALVHQQHRCLDPEGRVKAEVQDYEQVYSLVGDLISYQAGESVPPEIRETVEVIVDMTLHRAAGEGITASKVAEKLGIHRTTAGRRLSRALSMGYVALSSNGRNKTKIYVSSDVMPGDSSVLPHPDELR